MPAHERRQGRTEAKIELAFPFDSTTRQPKLLAEGQYVFAFLPLQRLFHLQFLIHSDFVTSASRETVIDCPWNLKLAEGIANTFVTAVTGTFAKPDHPCKHSWLDWLPKSGMERPWKPLYTLITESLATKPVAQTWEKGQFKAPNRLKIVVPCAIHRGLPILSDLEDEIYLAPGYTDRQRSRLRELKSANLNWNDAVDRLQADLSRPKSRLMTTSTTDSWHEAFADLFIQVFADPTNMVDTKQRIRRLAIIPLINGRQWTGAPGASIGGSNKVYFSYTDTIPIPGSLSLRLLNRYASQNAKRRAFYKALGVEDCPRETVFSKIKDRHQTQPQPSDIIDDMQYLYHQRCDWNHIKSWIWVPLTNGATIKAATKTLYFPSDGEFDMYQLVPSQPNLCFLSSTLYDIEPLSVRVNEESWRTWLVRILSARNYPLLMGDPSGLGDGHELSYSLKVVLEHNSAKFLGTLRAHWQFYQQQAHLVEKVLRTCRVPCRSGLHALMECTYLPTTDILNEMLRLDIEEDEIYLVNVSEATLDDATYRSWKFLEDFGVASRPNLTFYEIAIESKAKQDANVDARVIADIYTQIVRLATIEDHDDLRDYFNDCFIWDDDRNEWVTRGQCIWEGPEFISVRSVLARTYENSPRLHSFFSTILEVPSVSLEDVLQEIEARRDGEGAVAVSLMRQIYTYLTTEPRSDEDWRKIKNAFTWYRLILGDNGTWYTLTNCLWGSPFALSGLQDLSTIYTGMEDLFVRRLKVRKATLSMLIAEVKRMAEAGQPHIENIKTRLIEIGTMLARSPLDASVSNALASLKEIKFLPKRSSDGTSILVGIEDDFAISDHERYRDAFGSSNALLDFQVHEVQALHKMFQQVGLTHRYLSFMVREVSTAGENCIEHEGFSQQLQNKAYALYCCAAKYKSNKALCGDRILFEQLSAVRIYTTDSLITNLVLPLSSGPLRVPSERFAIHSDMSEDTIKIYVPSEPQQRQRCYRSQLPNLLTKVLSLSSAATFDIAMIVSSSIEELEDVLNERDIPAVAWIDRPVLVVPHIPDDERPVTPSSPDASSDSETLVPRSGLMTPNSTPIRYGGVAPAVDVDYTAETTPPPEYPELIEQVVQSARRAGHVHENARGNVADSVPYNPRARYYDHDATFGVRERNPFVHDRRIGAAGEGYVFEILSALGMPHFGEGNWRSTIRGELARSTRFANMANWTGRETADIVYNDDSGQLTQYLRDHSEGIFPFQIHEGRNFQTHPIEYYLEVKTTVGPCGTRFYMSSGQYKRMEAMALGLLESHPSKVYVIMRVYDLMMQDVGMKIFVDPLRFRGTKLNFEAEQWFVSTL